MAVLVLLSVFLVLLFQKPKAEISSLSYPVGEELTLSDVITKVKGGKLLNADKMLDSSKEGSVTFSYKVKNRLGIESEEKLVITFFLENNKENQSANPPSTPTRSAPQIFGPESLTVYRGGVIDLTLFTAKDHDGASLTVTLTGSYDLTKVGSYTPMLVATDEKGLKTEKILKLTVIDAPNTGSGGASSGDSRMEDGTFTTANGKTLIIKNGLCTVDGVLIANKSYSLPKSYTSPYLQKDAESAYYRMREGAKEAGFTLTIKSAYRSWNDQNYIFNGYVKNHGLEQALTFSARPGHSEHQTGLAMDLVTSSSVDAKTPAIKPTLDWLSENAYKFGYILRYPENKSHITGYIFEPWHYRYVGEDLAKELYNGGNWITLEEYFGIDSVYRGY